MRSDIGTGIDNAAEAKARGRRDNSSRMDQSSRPNARPPHAFRDCAPGFIFANCDGHVHHVFGIGDFGKPSKRTEDWGFRKSSGCAVVDEADQFKVGPAAYQLRNHFTVDPCADNQQARSRRSAGKADPAAACKAVEIALVISERPH